MVRSSGMGRTLSTEVGLGAKKYSRALIHSVCVFQLYNNIKYNSIQITIVLKINESNSK